MMGRGGRDRVRRDFPLRFDDKSISNSGHNNNKNPPSRNLWVGNLPHNIVESELAHHFLQFGQLASVAFQPGRSYAFINFKRDEDAIDAMNALQGFPVAGNPLRIEFAKADKPSTLSRDEDHSQERDERSLVLRGSPFSQREIRGRHSSPEPFYPDKTKMSDKNAEPSEVLWIGFPTSLKVDEMILRKAFSPFGEIEKITTFPGRSYAFVRFRSLMSACRARETMQGKLFGNPRVHICFAKNEAGSSSSGRNAMNASPSPHYRTSGRQGSSENFRLERDFGSFSGDPGINSPQFFPNWDSVDSDANCFNRNGGLRTAGINIYDRSRFGQKGSELALSHDMYEHPGSSTPTRDRNTYSHDFSERYHPKGASIEDPWDLPEDVQYFHEAKKLKTGPFPPREFPEYPPSDIEKRHIYPRLLSDFPQNEGLDRSFEAGPFPYRQTPDRTPNLPLAHAEGSDRLKQSYDVVQIGSGSQQSKFVDRRKFTLEPEKKSLAEWKWEGTIAKGGTPVCRARCFPVGKVLDIMLPEFLDCTARTGLDMLSKHYYQAAGAWVVFFVPESDADIGFYNEFMHYLEEKQRAAVAKLDDRTTLFLVPPSDFSQKVLKVPGKLSISGVVLRLEPPGSNFGPIHNQNETNNANLLSFNGDTFYGKQSPLAPNPPSKSLSELGQSEIRNLSFLGNMVTSDPPASFSGSAAVDGISNSRDVRRHEYPFQQLNPTSVPNWSSQYQHNSISGTRTVIPQVSHGPVDTVVPDNQHIMQRTIQDVSSNQYIGGIFGVSSSGNSNSSLQETRPSAPLSMPGGALQPEQLAQLTSSLLGQPRQSGSTLNVSTGEAFRQTATINGPETPFRPSQNFGLHGNQVNSEHSASQVGQVEQLPKLQQQTSDIPLVPHMAQREPQRGFQGNQQPQNIITQEEAEADPQKRLQATLQLAAALLQQIQQGK